MDYRGIAIDKVRYVGEPVAIVCATDRYKAEDALDYVKVDYEPLPAVVDPVAAEKPGAPILHEEGGTNVMSFRKFRHGEPEAAFEAAQHVSELTVHLSAQRDHADGMLCRGRRVFAGFERI